MDKERLKALLREERRLRRQISKLEEETAAVARAQRAREEREGEEGRRGGKERRGAGKEVRI